MQQIIHRQKDWCVIIKLNMKKYFLFGVFSCLVFFGGSSIVSANSNSIALSPTHTLLTYNFTETFANRDIVVPMLGAPVASHTPLTAGYQLQGITTDNIISQQAIVLSDAIINHGGYAVPERKKQSYMLLVLVEHTADVRPSAVALTALPVFLTTNGAVTSQTVKTY